MSAVVEVAVAMFLAIAVGLRVGGPVAPADPGTKVWDASDGKREPVR